MIKLTVPARNPSTNPVNLRVFKSETHPVSVDFSPLADENGNFTSATWTVESGTASVSGAAFFSNVATANVSFSDEGTSLIKISATNGTLTKNFFLKIKANSPDFEVMDYE